jgi:hypothetical protein
MKTQNFGVGLVIALVLLGCSRQQSNPETEVDPTASLPARFKTQERPAKPDFSGAAEDPNFQQAIKEASALLGANPQSLRAGADNEEVKGGVSFEVPHDKVEAILLQTHTDFLAKGFYLFRHDQSFGIGGRPDRIGLLPTTDKYAVMAAMDTNGDNYEIGSADVIAWMKELEAEQPFVLTGIGFDYMEGRFTAPVKDPSGLARRMYQFCPDIVDQGVGTVDKLAEELQKESLYFWWD